mmetsp:Transcript_8204/g.18425  ORF Transcript_8204/g.18425 Transcript_8204/m.18425 type:complete len:125 (+) Transcript_8204:170-544(+)
MSSLRPVPTPPSDCSDRYSSLEPSVAIGPPPAALLWSSSASASAIAAPRHRSIRPTTTIETHHRNGCLCTSGTSTTQYPVVLGCWQCRADPSGTVVVVGGGVDASVVGLAIFGRMELISCRIPS